MTNLNYKITLLLIIILFTLNLKGQSIIIRESNQDDGVSFCKLEAGKITVKAKIPLKKPKYILYWGTNGNDVYATDGNNIYSLNIITRKNKLIYISKEWINNFFVRNQHIYFTVTSNSDIDENEGRYIIKKHKINVLNCINKSILKQITIPFNCNIIGLSVSPNEKEIVFVNTLNIDNPKKTSYELVGFDTTRRKKEVYDKTYYYKNQWFIGATTYNSLSWFDNNTFYYLKKMGKGKNKGVYTFDLSKNASKIVFPELPQRDINWFIWDNNSIIYSNRQILTSFNGKNEKMIYKHNVSVLEGAK